MGRLARSKAALLVGALGIAAVLYLAFGVFGVQALFVDDEVNEEFEAASAGSPEGRSTQEGAPGGTTDGAVETGEEPTGVEPAQAESEGENAAGEESAGPVAVTSGEFHPVDHAGSGTATVYRRPDGSHVLRLTDLEVENGPDLYVYAVAAPDAYDEATVFDAGFLNLGRLKGNVGNQTYGLPADFDPETYRSISVWCQRFSSNFATAPLN